MNERSASLDVAAKGAAQVNSRVPLLSRLRAALAANHRARVGLSIGLLVAAVAVTAIWWHFTIRETTDDAQVDGHIVPIAARVGGTVRAVRVDDNQIVEAGDVLVEIDPRDVQVALARAEAELADAQANALAARTGIPIAETTTASQTQSAEANVRRAAAGLAAADARLGVAQARLAEAVANDTRAARDLDRLKELVAKDEVSQQQYDAAAAGATAAHAAVEGARSAVAEADTGRDAAGQALTQAKAELLSARTGPQQVEVTRARASSAEARLAQARAAVERARLDLEYVTIKAPAGGVVSKKSVEPGAVVAPGQALLAVVPLDDVWVTANFKETQLRHMRPGQPATISVDAYGRTYRGHVDSIAAATGARFSLLPPENASGNFVKIVQRVPVKIVLEPGENGDHLLRPGLSVVPTVITR